jgi:release factor glutamine methyltransferase
VSDEALEVLTVLRRTEQYLGRAGIESPRLDAEVLLAFVLKVPRIQLYAGYDRSLTPTELDDYRGLIRRRADREPVAYLTGEKEFYSLEFEVGPDVLVPRPDTEHLVDRALEIAKGLESPRLLDVGTGSGCIAVSWAVNVPAGRFVASDVSEGALAVAARNAERHGVADRGEFVQGDLFEPVSGPFDLVVSNPPYVAPDEETDPECLREPDQAVFTEGDPIGMYRRLLEGAPAVLAPGGWLLLELPGDREDEIAAAAPEGLTVVEVVCDYGGRPRVLVLRQ